MTADPNDRSESPSEEEEVDPGWPWSFLLLVGAGALYLIVRFAELARSLFP